MNRKIKVPFPKIEGMEVKSVTAHLEKGYSVVEYGEEMKFKRGDIVFARCNKGGDDWIILFDKIERNAICHVSALCGDYFECGDGLTLGEVNDYDLRIASTEMQQVLFSELLKQGKRWNDDTKEIEDLLLVPESVGIYQSLEKDFGDNLWIGFNNNKQLLGFNSDTGVWIVSSAISDFKKVQCYLQPCKRGDLKEGDTFFASDECDVFDSVDLYNKMLNNGSEAYTSGKIGVGVIDDYDYTFYYKLIPLND